MSTLDFGGRIKTLRLSKSMTQEQLAQRLRVSPQAVSKWENGVTLPDIQLLPELSILLGTSIDALFSMTDDKRMERIENMLWDQRFLSREEFEAEERFLKDKCLEPDAQARATLLLAELYCKRAREYRELASPLARKAIGLLPEYDKAAHTALFEAEGGVFPDWNAVNHHRTIEFYKDFIARHPGQRRAYLWLLDLLIDDGRCEEARAYLAKADRLETSYRSDLYLGMILEKEGKPEEASACWERMTQKDPDNWQSWFARADRLAKRCAYPEAIALYEKALALSPRPRFTDPVNAIAQLYEIQGQYEKAVEFYQKEIEIVREDWNETQGEAIDEPLRNIARLKEKTAESRPSESRTAPGRSPSPGPQKV